MASSAYLLVATSFKEGSFPSKINCPCSSSSNDSIMKLSYSRKDCTGFSSLNYAKLARPFWNFLQAIMNKSADFASSLSFYSLSFSLSPSVTLATPDEEIVSSFPVSDLIRLDGEKETT